MFQNGSWILQITAWKSQNVLLLRISKKLLDISICMAKLRLCSAMKDLNVWNFSEAISIPLDCIWRPTDKFTFKQRSSKLRSTGGTDVLQSE